MYSKYLQHPILVLFLILAIKLRWNRGTYFCNFFDNTLLQEFFLKRIAKVVFFLLLSLLGKKNTAANLIFYVFYGPNRLLY